MEGFTPKDREKLTEVHTLVKGHIGLIRDHEMRIRKQEERTTTIYAWIALFPFCAAIAWDWIKHKAGM
jgi:hypothetical protein